MGDIFGFITGGGEDSGAGHVADVSPEPVDEDGGFTAEVDEEEDVNEEPDEPAENPFGAPVADVDDGGALSDDGHFSFVDIAEGFRGRAVWRDDTLGDIEAFLGRCGSDSGDGGAIFLEDGGGVADDENLWMTGDGKVGSDFDLTVASELDTEVSCDAGGFHACGPDDGGGGDGFAIFQGDEIWLDV